jgi:hypothetical protein
MDLNVWHELYRLLCEDVPSFRYPDWFDYFGERIPDEQSRARRDVPRFLSLLQAVACCRSYSDGRREKSKNIIEINFADYCVAYRILSKAFIYTYVGAHPNVVEFAAAVRDLCDKGKKPVTTKDVAAHLEWENKVAHKWRVEAVKQQLVEYQPGTFPQNKKPLLPGAARHATTFLPDPRLVFRERPDLGEEVRFMDPLSGKSKILRRNGGRVELVDERFAAEEQQVSDGASHHAQG